MNRSPEPLSGWGRYPVADCLVERPGDPAALARARDGAGIARGNGRSYGDASLNPGATVETRRVDRIVSFDAGTGELVCEAGLLLGDLIAALLPRGYFPPVTPGTKFVTIGGMIASDVHGKNHHLAGSFCDHLRWIDLAIGDGSVRRCSRTENADLFAATCGGMGLTGTIVRAAFALIRVETAMIRQRTLRAPGLRDAIALFEQSADWTYSVAWIDCLASGSALGRSAIMLGEHAVRSDLPRGRAAAPLAVPARRARRVPIDLPPFALGRTSVSAFNRLYYAAQRPGDRVTDIEPYFYPLDALHDWNRLYGRGGFVQYQCVLPLDASEAGLTLMLREIARCGGASFLAVLKRMGAQSFGLLSFPMPGYTLALDFHATAANLRLLERLDAIVVDHGGRLYLAKDARAPAGVVAAGYPRLDQFRAVRRRYDLERRFGSLLSQRLDL